ncbi:hypothetical protein BV25DRAFT_1995881 [Artomyces pyxidatus]|uniref:Uncharacterized protein n=1 Tax=Artomyces pyxidatus TaxID=48021 RepID=A0ACB8SHV5_9AGAM|nr:hypothetical protein BV25DRAFT_1995881 [Artomyces pyxidatus]
MFGESDSESPRVPSPWDPVLSASPVSVDKVYYSPDAKFMPKLVAEAEEGNIEYKLHLIQPSPARFSRLVTQLKWRLLEGGGQAFYELGVADSGALIGLTPDDLAHTLATLRAMAAEIGARVVIVKQIEVVGMGVRAEDAREFTKKRKDKDKDRSAAKAKARARNIVDLAHPSSLTSVGASSFASTASATASSLASDSDSDVPALASSPSSSPSPAVLGLATPADGAVPEVIVELDEMFAMDPEPGVARTSPVPIPSPTQSAKALKRRIARDIRRAERQKALSDVGVGGEPKTRADELADALATSKVAEPPSPAPAVTEVTVPRMIVEAMVTRELDDDEAFLDFTRM